MHQIGALYQGRLKMLRYPHLEKIHSPLRLNHLYLKNNLIDTRFTPIKLRPNFIREYRKK